MTHIRRIRADEAPATYAIYRDAVRIGAARGYSLAERLAWVPSDAMEDWWPDLVLESPTWVAERDGGLAGLIALRSDGHLDLFFVRPEAQGDGTAVALYDRLVDQAKKDGHGDLTTFASLLLRPFLERRGWQVTEEQCVLRNRVPLTRFAMVLDPLE